MFDNEIQAIAEAQSKIEEKLKTEDISIKCPKCNGDLKTFQQLMEEGINCPHCKEPMYKATWFSNETNQEEERNNKPNMKSKE